VANGSFLVSEASRMRIRPMDRQPCRGFYDYLKAVVDPVAGPGHRFRGTCRSAGSQLKVGCMDFRWRTRQRPKSETSCTVSLPTLAEWLHTNPISLVRQSAKREKMPDVLDAEELKKLLAELQNPVRALVFLIAARGLRVSEALGLKWSDVDFGTGAINLSRGIAHQHLGEMKTEASQKPVPMDGALAISLFVWSEQTPYQQPENWVFASPKMNGKQP